MNFKDRDYSDEKLLAHVLGELDAAESLKFEEAAKNDPLLASRIESLKAECAKLADSFAEESRADAADEKITRERDEFIEAMLSLEAEHKKASKKSALSRLVYWGPAIAVAACAAFVFYVGPARDGAVPPDDAAFAARPIPSVINVENMPAPKKAPGVLRVAAAPSAEASSAGDTVDDLIEKGRREYLAGDLNKAQATISMAEKAFPENAKVKAQSDRLTYLATREVLLDEVSFSWKRPKVYDGDSTNSSGVAAKNTTDAEKRRELARASVHSKDGEFQASGLMESVPRSQVDLDIVPLGASVASADIDIEMDAAGINSLTDKEMVSTMPSMPSIMVLGSSSSKRAAPRIKRERVSGTDESYAPIPENNFSSTLEKPLSTFSINTGSASYANARRIINNGGRPPADAVRTEEFINYFTYGYKAPDASSPIPFAVHTALSRAPWDESHILMRVGIRVKDIEWKNRPASNLVFLVDVSGSMGDENKLPLVKDALRMLAGRLDRRDRVAIVAYASNVKLVLPSTTADNMETIIHAIDSLKAGGATSGEGGIELAYDVAQKAMLKDGVNRVIICSDGDFNVGKSSVEDVKELIKEKARSGVFLSVAGFGAGNYKDDMMESLAKNGNGNYSYVDSLLEAKKVFVSESVAKLNCMAKDVKIQVEFNPARVRSYKLLGYENRRLAEADFNNDKKDAGEAGAGESVTAIYEIIPTDVPAEDSADETRAADELKYSKVEAGTAHSDELATVKIRWKEPDAEISAKAETVVKAQESVPQIEDADEDFRFAVAAAMFAMKLRNEESMWDVYYLEIFDLAKSAVGNDKDGSRAEFLELVRRISL